MRRRLLIFALLVGAIVMIAITWPRPTEAEVVEAETVRAIQKLQILHNNTVKSSPWFAAEMILRRSKDPEGDYQKQFMAGMQRLVDLRVLEQRDFPLEGSKGRSLLEVLAKSQFTNDLLWVISYKTDGNVRVTAKAAEMIRWQRLIEGCAKNRDTN
jgi:hypothetical protein